MKHLRLGFLRHWFNKNINIYAAGVFVAVLLSVAHQRGEVLFPVLFSC